MRVGFSVAQKQMCQISGRGIIEGSQGVVYRTVCEFINTNGPAIWGGCVTRREHRVESWYFSQKTVTVQGGYGALFAVQVQNFMSITRVAVQVRSKPRNYPRLQSLWRALAQCRGTNYRGARNLSRCRILIAGR
jgi:hypothetical protein